MCNTCGAPERVNSGTHYSTFKHITQRTAVHCHISKVRSYDEAFERATHCITLHHATTHRNTLQHAATRHRSKQEVLIKLMKGPMVVAFRKWNNLILMGDENNVHPRYV